MAGVQVRFERKAQRLTDTPALNRRVQGPLRQRQLGGLYSIKDTKPTMDSKKVLRQQLRQARRNLTQQDQVQASLGVCRHIINHPKFLSSERVAVYFSSDGEVNLEPLMDAAWKMGKTLYLPVLHPIKPGYLVFMEYHPDQPMAKNRFGIPEPVSHRDTSCPTWLLDLILTPLVGFDEAGNRMGMGGGFYDRSFAFLKSNIKPRKPTLLGLAHECQKVDELVTEAWDIPMDGIVTGEAIYGAK